MISSRSRYVSEYRRYHRTHKRMITSSKCRPRKSAGLFRVTIHRTKSPQTAFATEPSWRTSWIVEVCRTVREQPIPVVYENVCIDTGFRADLIVEDKVIVEVKSVELLAPVHRKQLLTYLRLADKRLGLLINFQVALIKDGIARIVNGLEEDSHAKPPSRQDG